jgi:hypothetical protein
MSPERLECGSNQDRALAGVVPAKAPPRGRADQALAQLVPERRQIRDLALYLVQVSARDQVDLPARPVLLIG